MATEIVSLLCFASSLQKPLPQLLSLASSDLGFGTYYPVWIPVCSTNSQRNVFNLPRGYLLSCVCLDNISFHYTSFPPTSTSKGNVGLCYANQDLFPPTVQSCFYGASSKYSLKENLKFSGGKRRRQ